MASIKYLQQFTGETNDILHHERSKQAQKWRKTLYIIVKLKGKKIRCLATVICIKVRDIQTRGKQTLTHRAMTEYRYISNLKLYSTYNLYCSTRGFLIISLQKTQENSTTPAQLAISVNLKSHLYLTNYNSFSHSVMHSFIKHQQHFILKIWFELLVLLFLMLISHQSTHHLELPVFLHYYMLRQDPVFRCPTRCYKTVVFKATLWSAQHSPKYK